MHLSLELFFGYKENLDHSLAEVHTQIWTEKSRNSFLSAQYFTVPANVLSNLKCGQISQSLPEWFCTRAEGNGRNEKGFKGLYSFISLSAFLFFSSFLILSCSELSFYFYSPPICQVSVTNAVVFSQRFKALSTEANTWGSVQVM